jgi:hypothetical protein
MAILFIQMREIFVLSIILLVLVPLMASATTYRWVDKNGKVYYSHNVPPSAAQNGHTEIHEKSGRVLNDIASRNEREQQLQQAALLKVAEKEKELKMRENLSLQLFSSRTEVIKHFERRLEMVSVNLRLLQYHKRRLLKEITTIQQHTLSGKTQKEKRKASKRLQKLHSALLEHTRAIENNQKEQIMISSNKQRALSQYDEILDGDAMESDGLDSFLGGLKGDANKKSGCSCTCDTNKKTLKN